MRIYLNKFTLVTGVPELCHKKKPETLLLLPLLQRQNFIKLLFTSWDNWIKHFSRCASANNWSKEREVVMLSTKLVRKALEEYECLLDENEQIPFDDLVKAIGKEVRPSQKVALQTYLNRTLGNDSPKAFYSKLMDQSKLMYPEADVTQETRMVLVKTQFIQALLTTLIEDVAKQANPHTLAKYALLEICT